MQYPRPTTRPRLGMLDLRRPQGQIALILVLTLVLLGVGVGVTLANPIVSLQLSASSDPIVEGNSGSTVVNFVIKLSQAVGAGQSVVIRVSTSPTASNAATLNTDYSASSTDFTFSPGDSQKTFPVTITGDTVDELNEGFLVNAKILSSTIGSIQPPVGSTISTTAIINDDDNPTVASISDPTATEGTNATIDFVVTLDKVSALEDISIAYSTADGSATSGSDYTGTASGALLIPKGSTSGTIKIPLLSDAVNEPTETFTINLNPATSLSVNTPFSDASATGTIIDANDAPLAADDGYSTNEDTALNVAAPGVLTNDSDPEGGPITAVVITPPTNGTLTLNADGSFNYSPAANYNGPDSFTYKANDGNSSSLIAATVSLTVNPVNDAPSLTPGANVTVLEDSAAYLAAWATAIAAGPANESAQALTISVTNDNNALFSAQPGVDKATGKLSFTPAANANGVANVTVDLSDDGGTASGGVDSASYTFTITITAVNDAPSFTPGADVTVLEDAAAYGPTVWATALSAGPANESAQTLSFTVTNNNNALFSVQPALDTTGKLAFTPAANANGAATVSATLKDSGGTANGGVDSSAIKTFTITVTAVNDAPSLTPGANVTVLEDSAAYAAAWATAIAAGPANESAQVLTISVTNNNNALFSAQPSLDASGKLSFTPAANANGVANVTVDLKDNGGTANSGVDTATYSFTITITAVNDAPSLTPGANVTVLEDSAAYAAAWATAIAAGPANESAQVLTISVTNDNNALFSAQPSVDKTTGILSFTPAANASGSANVTVGLSDDGGTANGGVDSASYSFTITITAVNDAPSFTPGADVTVLEDAAAYGPTAWATALSAGPANESAQTLSFTVTNNNNSLFSVQPALDTTGKLAFTPAANANGAATVSVTLKDSGGTANGGVDSSAAQTFTITITAVNDAPSLTPGANVTVLEDSGAYLAAWATAIAAGPANESAQALTISVTNDNNALFSAQPSIDKTTGILSFTPAANASGSANVTVGLSDDGGTASGGVDSASYSFTITVTAVNDAPSFTPGADVTVLEDAAAYGPTVWATALSAGPANESAQTLSFTVTNNNNALFSVQPALDATGKLAFTPAANANGAATVSVTLKDSGGTANGGVDSSAAQTFTITITAVNDAPVLTPGADVTVLEDSGAYAAAWATTIAAGPANESAQVLTISVTNNNNALFSAQPSLDASGKLSFTPAANVSGSAIVSVDLKDDGGTANGGVDTLATKTFTITVTAVNDAPAVDIDSGTVGIDGSASFTENAAATAITGASLTVADQEGDQVASATVKITNPQNGAAESLAVNVGASGITASYDAPSGTLTLTGPATAGAFQGVLQTLTYANSSDNPGISRIITIAATDSGTPAAATTSPAAQISLTIAVTDDAPALTNTGLTVAEGGTGNITAAELSASDPDTVDASLVFTIGVAPANGQLRKGGAALGAGGSFTQADIAGGLLSYVHDGSNTASDSFSFSLSDGTTVLSGQTFAITVQAVNDAPVITLSGGATSYQLGAPAVAIDASATVTDSDSLDFAGGQLRVALTGAGAGDVLSVANQGAGAGQIGLSGASVTYGGVAIGTLSGGGAGSPLLITLNASATPAAAQALARSITFRNAAATTTPGSRAATFTISDGDGLTSAPASKTITFNLPPTAVDDTAAVTINFPQKIDVLANDSDLNGDALTIGAVTQGARGTVTVDAGGKGLTYTPAKDYVGGDSFTYTASDGKGGSDTATVQVTVRRATVFLPMISGRIAKADLKVSFRVSPTAPQAGKPASIQVTVTNSGEAAATNFWVDFYLSPSRTPQVNDPWNEVCKLEPCFGLAWFYTGSLEPGQSVLLNSAPQSSANPNGYKADASIWPGYFANGTTKLYAIVDSWNRDSSGAARNPAGAIEERDETNNRAEQSITVSQGNLPQTSQLDGLRDLSAGR